VTVSRAIAQHGGKVALAVDEMIFLFDTNSKQLIASYGHTFTVFFSFSLFIYKSRFFCKLVVIIFVLMLSFRLQDSNSQLMADS
jgi:hypothetical protein